MRLGLILILLLITACTTAADIRQDYAESMAGYGFQPVIYDGGSFKIFGLQKITDNAAPVRIYVEGDGKAFVTAGMASPDPTPGSSFLVDLIKKDKAPNIIYLGRPCQYGLGDKNCEEKYWTTARFAPEIISAYDKVLNGLTNRELELVGYSGGGAVIMMVAEKHNVKNIRTIAGNINHKKFNRIHDVEQLSGSLDPVFNSTIPQIHFVGEDDKIVPRAVAESYPANSCVQIYDVKKATHWSGWNEQWADLLKISPLCK